MKIVEDLSKYNNKQIKQLKLGKDYGIDIRCYMNPLIPSFIMERRRLDLECSKAYNKKLEKEISDYVRRLN